jgi:septum formation protein
MTVAVEQSDRLILASRSPRRQELLRQAGYEFDIDPADVDEDNYPATMLPSMLAIQLARNKAQTIADRHPEAVVLGADTVVAFGDEILGKPVDEADARRILTLLSGTTHIVITGVSVICRETGYQRHERSMSSVRMNVLKLHEINAYLATGDWQGKAGGYGIQDNDPFVTRIAGDHTNIVGLPMSLVAELLAETGIFPRDPGSAENNRQPS